MTDKPENPQAFPGRKWTPDNQDVNEGMTLRDYFAAAALQGILANPSSIDFESNYKLNKADGWFTEGKFEGFSDFSYQLSDAMLKARQS